MATYTTNFNLAKPEQNEAVDIDVLNNNSDIIDDNLGQAKQLASNIGNAYNNTIPYFVGDYCVYDNKLYKCIQNIVTPENFDITKWQQCSIGNELQNIKGNPNNTATATLTKLQIGNDIYQIEEGANDNIADAYDATSTYDVGDYVIYHDNLYKCTTAVSTAEPFDNTKWTTCLVTDEMGSGFQMTILSYGTSTWNDFITAYQSNSIVYCRAASGSSPQSGSQNRLAFMAYVNDATSPTEVEFQYYRSVATHTASQQGDQVYVYKLNSTGTWSVTTREASTKIVAGTNMTSSYSNGVLTLNATGSGGSGGHTILDNSGTALTQRDDLQFVGTYSEDDSTDEITKINIVREMTKNEFDNLSDDEKTGIIITTDEPTYIGRYGETILSSTVTTLGSGAIINLSDDYTNYDAIYINFEPVSSTVSNYNGSLIKLVSDIELNTDYVGYSVYDSYNYGFLYQFTDSDTISAEAISPSNANMKINKVVGIKFGGANSSGDIKYSTDEQIVGEWIDGSTLYQKTFDLGSSGVVVPSQQWYVTDVDVSYVSLIVDCKICNSTGGGFFGYFGAVKQAANDKLGLLNTRNTDQSIQYVTIQYTKSTT